MRGWVIRTQEKLRIPEAILGRVEEKDSKMIQEWVANGHLYEPRCQTYAF